MVFYDNYNDNLILMSSWDSIDSLIELIHPSVTPDFPIRTTGFK